MDAGVYDVRRFEVVVDRRCWTLVWIVEQEENERDYIHLYTSAMTQAKWMELFIELQLNTSPFRNPLLSTLLWNAYYLPQPWILPVKGSLLNVVEAHSHYLFTS